MVSSNDLKNLCLYFIHTYGVEEGTARYNELYRRYVMSYAAEA